MPCRQVGLCDGYSIVFTKKPETFTIAKKDTGLSITEARKKHKLNSQVDWVFTGVN